MNRQRPPGGTPVLRRLNTAQVLEAIRRAAPASVRIAELARETGLTRPTVAQAVDDLTAGGLVTPVAPSTKRGVGRPAARVRLNGMAAPVLGIDLGVHSVAAAVADLTGRELALSRRSIRSTRPERMLDAVQHGVMDALAQAGVAPSALGGVTIGSSGIFDPRTGLSTMSATTEWIRIDLRARLSGLFRCPVRVENNANVVAHVVSSLRSSAGDTVIAVQWGERMGCGLVIEGRLFRGAHSAAGEMGFISLGGTPVGLALEPHGPLEAAIGTPGIVALAKRAAAGNPTSSLATLLGPSSRARDAGLVFQAATEGDSTARAVVDEVARTFALAMAPVVNTLDPDAIVIGGGIARAGSVLSDAIARHLAQLTLVPPTVELLALAEDTVVKGAVMLAIEGVWERLLAGLDERVPASQGRMHP